MEDNDIRDIKLLGRAIFYDCITINIDKALPCACIQPEQFCGLMILVTEVGSKDIIQEKHTRVILIRLVYTLMFSTH
ncbi:hypothetical protein FRX31_017680 [Thalictrum thalictroides]|uniref:Uncharacterized protein n=1 Tax=Thalictrum thalictroides TaxID=46969 RepID=A0A7J6W6T8_THATH|nr:hypothetical protein FRX31_017680 [Thalictrum thalictroides]